MVDSGCEAWSPSRMITANVRGEQKVVAIEWVAIRDPERKMKLRWVLRGFAVFMS